MKGSWNHNLNVLWPVLMCHLHPVRKITTCAESGTQPSTSYTFASCPKPSLRIATTFQQPLAILETYVKSAQSGIHLLFNRPTQPQRFRQGGVVWI